MDIQNTIKNRRSVRKFLAKAIEPEIVNQIIESANWAPSACNIQGWRFIIVNDQKLKEKIVDRGGPRFIKDAPLGILVVYDERTENLEYQDHIQSASAAIQNLILAASDRGLGSCWVCQLPKKKELKEISIAFAYNSNAIEGSTITLEEVRGIIQENIAPNKPLKDIKEIENHNKIFLGMLKKKERITNSLILKWHRDIFGETKSDIAGKYRNYLVRVGSYIAPDWKEVIPRMNRLTEFVNKSKLNPVELAARAHYKFEAIHPFGDGNGRIGRLLMNYILWHKNYPMLIIEHKKRTSYYKAFPKGQEAFVDYFLRRYLAVHKRRIFS